MFDLLSAEYGWTDDQILDLPLDRLVLARDAVARRRRDDFERQALLMESQTKFLVNASFGAAGSKLGPKAASQVSFFERAKRVVVPRTSAVLARFGRPMFPSEPEE